jgi:hypothetical protein
MRRSTYGSYGARLRELGSDDLEAVTPNAAAAPKSSTPAEEFGRLSGRHAALLEHALETSGVKMASGRTPSNSTLKLGAGTGDGLVVCHAIADLPLHHAALPPIDVLPKADIRRCAPHVFRSLPLRPDQAGSPATRVSMSMTSVAGISQAPTAAGTRSPRTGSWPAVRRMRL